MVFNRRKIFLYPAILLKKSHRLNKVSNLCKFTERAPYFLNFNEVTTLFVRSLGLYTFCRQNCEHNSASGAEYMIGAYSEQNRLFWPFCIFWGLGTSLRRSWARASEQNKMAEPNPQPVEVTDHDQCSS